MIESAQHVFAIVFKRDVTEFCRVLSVLAYIRYYVGYAHKTAFESACKQIFVVELSFVCKREFVFQILKSLYGRFVGHILVCEFFAVVA